LKPERIINAALVLLVLNLLGILFWHSLMVH
jgi:hypothetical protein